MTNWVRITWLVCAISAMLLGACHQNRSTSQKLVKPPARETIGDQLTLLEVHVGNAWGHGYSVRVFPEEYVILEYVSCPYAKRKVDNYDRNPAGICVMRIDKQQSDQFEAAMASFRRQAVPLSSFSFGDPDKRPDGKPCRSNVTDQDLVSLIWNGTKGAQIATFYTGCDQKDFAAYYNKLSHLTDDLPIHSIIAKR